MLYIRSHNHYIVLLPPILQIHENYFTPPHRPVPPLRCPIPGQPWYHPCICATPTISPRTLRHPLPRHTEEYCARRISHHGSNRPHGNPVAATACRVLHLQEHHTLPNTPICTYYAASSMGSPTPKPTCATGRRITATLRKYDGILGFDKLGFHPHEIVSHSLYSGGAMTLHLSSHSKSTTKSIGRWRSNGFLVYL